MTMDLEPVLKPARRLTNQAMEHRMGQHFRFYTDGCIMPNLDHRNSSLIASY